MQLFLSSQFIVWAVSKNKRGLTTVHNGRSVVPGRFKINYLRPCLFQLFLGESVVFLIHYRP